MTTRKQIEIDIDKIRKLNRSKPREAAKAVLEAIDNMNQTFEDSTRFSVYKTALDKGISREQAAIMAKNSTVNFNKKGTGGSVINGLWMFANASIQGSTKMLKAMRNPKVAAAVTMTMGTAVWSTNRWNDSVDPEWRDKVEPWDRRSNLVVALPTSEGVRYMTIPVSWGLKPFKAASDFAYDAAYGHGKGAYGATKGILAAIIDSYNPVGGTSLASAITPTVLDPISDIRSNLKWTGSPLRPDSKEGVPKSQEYFKNKDGIPSDKSKTFGFIQKMTSALSEKTGGEIEMSPADVKYAADFLTGGTGRALGRVAETVSSIGQGEMPQTKDIPFVNRFLKSKTDAEVEKSQGYSEKDKLYSVLKKAPKEDQPEMIQKYLETLPEDKRKGAAFGLMLEGFNTKGTTTSANVIEAKKLYNQWKDLSPEDRTKQIAEWKKTQSKDEGTKILTQVQRERKNDIAVENGLVENWMNLDLDERATELIERTSEMPKEERINFLESMFQQGIISDDLKKKYVEMRSQ